jgi:transcriptional antiterminator
MRSLLPEILHFTEEDIDWKECEDIANGSLVHEIWDLWNNGVSAYEIQDKLKVSKFTIRNYINRGYDIGICHERCYFKKDKRAIKGNNGNHLFTIKPLYCYEENSYYVSSSEYIKMHSRDSLVVGSINRAAKNQITYKGKHFKYITKQEFNNFKLLSLNNPDIKVYGELIDTKYL